MLTGGVELRKNRPAIVRESYFQDAKTLGDLYIHCIHPFFATFSIIRNCVAFTDLVDQAAYVYKNLLL